MIISVIAYGLIFNPLWQFGIAENILVDYKFILKFPEYEI